MNLLKVNIINVRKYANGGEWQANLNYSSSSSSIASVSSSFSYSNNTKHIVFSDRPRSSCSFLYHYRSYLLGNNSCSNSGSNSSDGGGNNIIKKRRWRRHGLLGSTRPVLVLSEEEGEGKENEISINGKAVLKGVPDNLLVTPLTETSAFLGASFTLSSSRHVFRLGLIRFKLWWMIPRMVNCGSDIPVETQMLLMEVKGGLDSDHSAESTPSYVVFLPVLDGEFRSSLQGNTSDELECCVESGDPAIVTKECLKAVFVNHGNHPFDLIKESMKALQEHFGTFRVREEKQMPGMLDWFGWCTWDAFYQEVNPHGIIEGLKSLSEGGTPARFLIIDDGWQDTINEFQIEGELNIEGSQFGGRLASIRENKKFRRTANGDQSDKPSNLKNFVLDIKRTFGLKYVYVWHALMGYWGGLAPNAPGTKMYNPTLTYPVQSPGNLANMRDISMDCMEKYGIGAIDPNRIAQFYNDLHSYLASQGVDGVKVDVQNILETVAAGIGGRVSLTRHFQHALEKSIATNFQDNSIICCMGQSTDSLYHSKRSAIMRASDDYYPKNPATQTLQIAAVSFNSIFLGEVVVPDWDMFYSLHEAAEFHAVARAVGGCGVYISDKPGRHDFKVLQKLVLPDGSVLRARYPGRPSRDCLFIDPVMDGKSLLKIWNLNKCTGVIGVFNCQGAGTWPCLENGAQTQKEVSGKLCGQVSPADVEYFEEVSGDSWTGDCAIYSFKRERMCRLKKQEKLDVALEVLECDVFTVSPIKVYREGVEFAPIGLLNMYNSGGAIKSIIKDHSTTDTAGGCRIQVTGRGGGAFGAYSSVNPNSCSINSEEAAFLFRQEDNLLTLTIPSSSSIGWNIEICY